MGKLAAPYVSLTSGRSKSASAFNEGVQVPRKDWDALVARKPSLGSKNKAERTEAVRKEILHGELAKYRRR